MKAITLRVEDAEYQEWRIAALKEGAWFGEWLKERLRRGVRAMGAKTEPAKPQIQQSAKPGVQVDLREDMQKATAEAKAEADLKAMVDRKKAQEELKRLTEAGKAMEKRYGKG